MPFYLVSQKTVAGMQEAKRLHDSRNYGKRLGESTTPWMPYIYEMIGKVTGQVFDAPVPIRPWFKANRDGFCGGKDPNWDVWLNGDTSDVETICQKGFARFFFMDTAEFDVLDNEQKKRLGFSRAA